jgi:hypothetical protein
MAECLHICLSSGAARIDGEDNGSDPFPGCLVLARTPETSQSRIALTHGQIHTSTIMVISVVKHGRQFESGWQMDHPVLTVGFVEDRLIVSSVCIISDPGSLTHGVEDGPLNAITPPSRYAASQALYGSNWLMAISSDSLSSAVGFMKA